MTETTLHISKSEKKVSKTGNDYLSLDTNQGKMTAFEDQAIKDLERGGVPGDFKVEVTQKGNFKSIAKVYLDEEPEVIRPFDQIEQTEQAPKALDEDEMRFASMCISYAKDLAMTDKIKLSQIRTWAYDFLHLYQEMAGKDK